MAIRIEALLTPVPDLDDADEAWMQQAACKGKTHIFFGIPGERPERRTRRESLAGRYCAGCPVLSPCRATARRNHENGYWGGESEEDRAAAGYPPISISRRAVLEAAVAARARRAG
jgi:WhiB family redox-sensing transcriptional regulator